MNRTKTAAWLAGLTALLLRAGGALGGGGGAAVALAFAAVMNLGAWWWWSDRLVLNRHGACPVGPADESANAFATGRGPERAAGAVTEALLRRLDRDEFEGAVRRAGRTAAGGDGA